MGNVVNIVYHVNKAFAWLVYQGTIKIGLINIVYPAICQSILLSIFVNKIVTIKYSC